MSDKVRVISLLVLVTSLITELGTEPAFAQTPSQSAADRFGRIGGERAPEYRELSRNSENPKSYGSESYYAQMLIHRAHVVMLTEQKILTEQEGAALLQGLRQVQQLAGENDGLKSYMATERSLIDTIGNVGGRMHIGRSRNDLGQAQSRIYYRDQLNDLIRSVIEYQKAVTRKAEENLDTVMPGYTHRRQAQPVTLAHYLMAHVQAAERSVERLEGAYARTNRSALGAAALAGTGWPLDRVRTMELLGFDGMVENTQDAVAAWDYIAEIASAIAIHMTNLSRLGADLKVWSSDEWAMIDLDEAYAGTSSIMPQKKNPSAVETITASSSESLGALVAIVSSLNGIEYTNTSERVRLQPHILDLALGSTDVMAGFTATVRPMKERMLALATEGFSTTTELADTLVRKTGISFRQAHDIVAHAVLAAIAGGQTADQITADMIQEAALESMGERIDITSEDIRSAMNPTENVARRDVIGGPAPRQVQTAIENQWEKISSQEARLNERLESLESAHESLEKAEAQILRSGS